MDGLVSRSSSVLLHPAHPPHIFNKTSVNSPNGPLTVIVRLYVLRYEVTSFLTNKSPIATSTPGGTESGVRPSFDCRAVVAEKLRRAAAGVCDWNAGTRKPGNVTVEGDEEAVVEDATARCRAWRPAL